MNSRRLWQQTQDLQRFKPDSPITNKGSADGCVLSDEGSNHDGLTPMVGCLCLSQLSL